MTSISAEEEKQVVEFRERVKDILSKESDHSGLHLIKWIRARECDLDKAEIMIRESAKWRKENQIDELLASSPDPYFTKNFPIWLNGVDKLGRPVLCVPMGDWDVRKAVDDNRADGFTLFVTRLFERVLEGISNCNGRKGPDDLPIAQFCLLVNWDNFSIRQTSNLQAVQRLLHVVSVFEAHYPEILGQAFFVNTNTIFQAFFALMKPILAPRTLSKITCYGANRTDWEREVRTVVEEHQIPRQFGG